jgi:hypothetical protein
VQRLKWVCRRDTPCADPGRRPPTAKIPAKIPPSAIAVAIDTPILSTVSVVVASDLP